LLVAILGTCSWGCTATSSPGGAGGSTAGGAGGSAAGGDTGGTSGGKTFDSSKPPCDIYDDDGGPCVAAHSTIRRLSSKYTGALYQIRVGGSKSGTGGSTTDIGFGTDGFADGAAQDTACGDGACTISIIYDQSGKGNHLTFAPAGGQKTTPDNEANAKALPATIGGHNVYGVHVVPGIGYRNNKAVGTATGDNAETEYMVVSGTFSNGGCCFDYGNAETNSRDNGEGTMEAVYFGTCTIWGKGDADGPWVMGDLENGLWAGNTSPFADNKPVTYKYVTGMVKGAAAGKNRWAIKVGDAQSGVLTKPFEGTRPSSRYNPMRKEGAIILGTGGDNSNGDQGNFFEGLMTAHYSSDAADNAIQANIVAAYGTGGGNNGTGGSSGSGGNSGTGGSSGSGGNSGSGGSSGSGGNSGSSGSSGSGGNSGSSGSSGSGGASGSSGGSVTTLSSTKALGTLSTTEATQLCNDAYAYFNKNITQATACRWTGLSWAGSSSAPNQDTLRQFCTDHESTCLKGDPAASFANPGCDPLPSTCTMTVADYSTCITDHAADFTKQVTGLPTCAALKSSDTTVLSGIQAADLPKSCTAITDKCATITLPNLFIK